MSLSDDCRRPSSRAKLGSGLVCRRRFAWAGGLRAGAGADESGSEAGGAIADGSAGPPDAGGGGGVAEPVVGGGLDGANMGKEGAEGMDGCPASAESDTAVRIATIAGNVATTACVQVTVPTVQAFDR